MAKNPAAITAEIERLRAELVEAEKAESERLERAVLRAAKRSGLLRLGLSAGEFESRFRELVATAKGDEKRDDRAVRNEARELRARSFAGAGRPSAAGFQPLGGGENER